MTKPSKPAGVGRVTFYRHFPDERVLLRACTGHYFALNPPPDPTPWSFITDPFERARTALGELYAFYGRTEAMLARAEQEAPTNPILSELMQPFNEYQITMREMLVQAWCAGSEPDPLVRAAIGHALAFATWCSLVRRQELSEQQTIALMLKLIDESNCGE